MIRDYDGKEIEFDVQTLAPDDIISAYSGKDGHCCCGCAGKHVYNSLHVQLGSQRRGYKVSDDEINDRQVTRILRQVQANEDDCVAGENHIAVTVGKRLYIVYPKDMVIKL